MGYRRWSDVARTDVSDVYYALKSKRDVQIEPVPEFHVFRDGESCMPGYGGHIPELMFHGAGRTYGNATKDTCCIMSHWGECHPIYPRRIYEQ